MSKEISGKDPNAESRLNPIDPPIEYTKKIPSSEGRLDRFFQRVNQFFKRDTPPSTPLQGRIHELQSNADTALEHLLEAKKELEQKSDDVAFKTLLNSVLDPFIKEVSRIQRAMDQDSTTPHQVKVSSRYSDWIEKAKWWAETCAEFESSEAACPVLLAHAVEEFHGRIDRDIQIIQDYLNQSMHSLDPTSLFPKEAERRLAMELGLHFTALQELKTVPPEETIEAFHVWRVEVDHLREQCFTDALHSIDSVAGDINPDPKHAAGAEHIDDVYPELRVLVDELETKLASLTKQIEEPSEMDKAKKKQCILELILLEKQASFVNGDLRLRPEQSDRVQTVLEILATFRGQIL